MVQYPGAGHPAARDVWQPGPDRRPRTGNFWHGFLDAQELQLRREALSAVSFRAFNFLNHPNFGDPGTSLFSNTLNSAGVPIVGTGSLGVIKSTRGSIDMRELQFSLKLVF